MDCSNRRLVGCRTTYRSWKVSLGMIGRYSSRMCAFDDFHYPAHVLLSYLLSYADGEATYCLSMSRLNAWSDYIFEAGSASS